MVMTKFAAEVLLRFLASGLTSDKSKDLHYSKVDQLPPFDLTLLFTNESGWASYQRVLGVEFVTSADIYSIQDMLTEQSVSYLARDITPLLPLNFSSFYRLGEQTDKTRSLRPMKPKPFTRGRESVIDSSRWSRVCPCISRRAARDCTAMFLSKIRYYLEL